MYYLNRDPDWDCDWIWTQEGMDDSTPESCIKGIEKIFGEYQNPITDAGLCLFCQVALLPSKAYTWGGERWPEYYNRMPDAAKRWKRPYKMFAEYKIDPVQIFIDTVRKNNIRPWASFRINDIHPPSIPTRMYVECAESDQMVGSHNFYSFRRNCFDFAYPKYRNALRDLIKEVFDKYDFFGIELDFMREPYCLDYKGNPECHKIMTEYIREIKGIMREAEKRLGHDIKIFIRVPSTPSTCMEFGFDVKTMVDEGLVDVVAPAPHQVCTDSGISVKEWKEWVGNKVPIVPGIESSNLKCTSNTTVPLTKGYLASFFGQGAEGAHLYNYFMSPFHVDTWKITREDVLRGTRQFIVTYQDCFAYEENQYKPLPMRVDCKATLPLEVGRIKSTDKVSVIIDYEGDTAPTLSVAGKENVTAVQIEPIIRPGQGPDGMANLTEHTPLSFDISGIETPSHLDPTFNGKGTVHYVELEIDAK